MKQHNIVIAGRTDMIDTLNQLASSLRSSARLMFQGMKPIVSVISDIESVKDYVADGDVSTLVISETINSVDTGSDVTISQSYINEWKGAYPDMLVILVIDANKRGGVKLKKLFDEGYFNALYISDFKQHNIIDLIREGGRQEGEAFKYYGLDQGGMYEAPKEPEVAPEPVQQRAPKAPRDDRDGGEDIDALFSPRAERPRRAKKSSYMHLPKENGAPERDELYEDDEERRPRRERPAERRDSRRDREYEDDDRDELDYREDTYDEGDDYEDEYEEDERPAKRRRSRRRKTRIYPMPEDCQLYFGEVEDIDEDKHLLYVKVPIQGSNVVLDESFIGSQVFFVVSTDE